MVVEELEAGSRFREGRVVVAEEEVEADKLVHGDLRRARVMTGIANSIFPFLQFTLHCPSQPSTMW